jgi:hypothetical protein
MPATGGMRLLLMLSPALLVGALVRAIPILASDFPMHDGGLFLVMMEDLRNNGFAIPATTTYNVDSIPFSYPPLALYLGAGLSGLGLGPLDVLRLLPWLFSVAAIPLLFLIARQLTASDRTAAVAAVVFALIPRAYEWQVIGGGLTRGLGLLFAMAAIWQALVLIKNGTWRHAAFAGIFAGGCALTHPETTLFLFVTAAVLLVPARRAGVLPKVGLGLAIAAAMVVPWAALIIGRHGFEAIVGAADSRTAVFVSSMRELLFGEFTGAASMNVFIGLGLVGTLLEVSRRKWLLPIWVVATMAVVVAAGATYAMVPWAILVAIAVDEALVPAFERVAIPNRIGKPILEVGLFGAGLLASLATGYSLDTPLHPLAPDEPAAMEWARDNLPSDARVVVITGLPWWNDATSEWFPGIARRHSVATAQGYEWTGEFAMRHRSHQLLQEICARGTVQCLREWMVLFQMPADYVYVPKGQLAGIASPHDCCPAMRASIRDELEVVFDGDGATIAELR